jgi:hypothetical protein
MKCTAILRGSILAIALMVSSPVLTEAQCPMCRMSVESNLKNGGTAGRGLNAGILYLLMTPYLLVGGLAYVWWRNKKRREDMALEDNLREISQ